MIVPAFLTRGMDEEKKERFEESYKNGAWVLRIMREHLETKLTQLVIESESMSSHEQLLKNVAERKAIRELIRYFPEQIKEANNV